MFKYKFTALIALAACIALLFSGCLLGDDIETLRIKAGFIDDIPNVPVISIETQPAETTKVTVGEISGSLSVTASIARGTVIKPCRRLISTAMWKPATAQLYAPLTNLASAGLGAGCALLTGNDGYFTVKPANGRFVHGVLTGFTGLAYFLRYNQGGKI